MERRRVKMELISSAISERWKVCTIGGFVGLLMLVLLMNENRHQTVSFSAFRSTVVFSSISCRSDEQPISSNHSSSASCSGTEASWESLTAPAGAVLEVEKPAAESNSSRASTYPRTEISETPAAAAAAMETRNETISAPGSSTMLSDEEPSGGTAAGCDIFDGRWVYEAGNAPLYSAESCPFVEEKMSCRKNGRPDFDYEKWSWEPRGCRIPEFNGLDMLERLRGKRMVMVGDSLNRNQWESLACLLYASIPSSRSFVDADDPAYKVFRALDYSFVAEFYWSPFLVELDEKHKSGSKVLVLDKISSSSDRWKGADIMVFNSAHWWIHLGKFRSWDLFEYENKIIKDMNIEAAYDRGLTTWANWIEQNVDPNKTAVFFRSISSEHNGGGGGSDEQWCYNSTRPIADRSSYRQRYPRSMIDVVEGKIRDRRRSARPVRYLNITEMSEYRIDAHPSVYRSRYKWKVMTTKYKRLLRGFADCSHWCLPGVPDTWNRLLYVSLFFDTPASTDHLSSL